MNKSDLQKLIAVGEGQNLEFKQSVSDDLGREICSFANSTGGTILIGVSDRGEILPLTGQNRLRSEVQNHARNCDPPVQISVDATAGVLVVTVPASRDKPHSARGHFYLREGANAQRMNRSQIREFFFKEGLIFFDAAINRSFRIETDMSSERYRAFAQIAGIPADMEPADALRNIGLLSSEGMTNAGVLALGCPASRYLVSATVTCALFQGTTKTKILDQKVFDEDIASNFHNALVYLQSHLNTEYIITSVR